jgi:hypothetical protein
MAVGLFGERPGEVAASFKPVGRVLGHGSGQNRVEAGEVAPCVGQCGWVGVEVMADDDRRVGMRERLRTGEQVVGGRGECVLVGAAVELLSHELFGSRVGNGADGHVCCGESADILCAAGNSEVSQQDSLFGVLAGVGEHDVGGFDVAVQQPLFVGVVERCGDGGDDRSDLVYGPAG